jgi:hypothetical protein
MTLEPLPGVDGTRAMRWVLKGLLRQHGMTTYVGRNQMLTDPKIHDLAVDALMFAKGDIAAAVGILREWTDLGHDAAFAAIDVLLPDDETMVRNGETQNENLRGVVLAQRNLFESHQSAALGRTRGLRLPRG